MFQKAARFSITSKPVFKLASFPAALLLSGALMTSVAISANGYQSGEISNNLDRCKAGSRLAMLVTVSGVKSSEGRIRVQSYRATRAEWLESGKWLNRIEVAAKAGEMTFCIPVPEAGTYGVAIRHDINNNGKTDITKDGGGMSNNPSINIFNLGKPSYTKVGVPVTGDMKSIRIQMKYM
jgi:uncharacterized protein (DUF2141 family)